MVLGGHKVDKWLFAHMPDHNSGIIEQIRRISEREKMWSSRSLDAKQPGGVRQTRRR